MKKSTADWVKKAEEDHAVALREHKAKPVFYNIVCFHAQQAVEKYIKAFLQEKDIHFPKTHHLGKLLELAMKADVMLVSFQKEFAYMDDLSVDIRYPGSDAVKANADKSVEIMKKLRKELRVKLGLDG